MSEGIPSFPAIGDPEPQRRFFSRRIPITIEPILFLIFFSFSVSDGVIINVLLSRTCSVIYGLPDDKCSGQIDPDVEELVQPYATKITMYRSILEAVVTGILAMFVGPWSDKNGRKPFLVIPLAGFTLNYIITFVLAHIPSAAPLWFLVPSAFLTFSGGLVSIFTSIFCYITDITNENNRAFRMAIISSATSGGIVCGYLTSFYVAIYCEDYTPTVLLSLANGASLIALLYTVIILPESLVTRENDDQGFFHCKNVKDMFEAVFRRRLKSGRIRLILSILVIGIGILILQGDFQYKYYALRKSFEWSLEHYNIYSAISCAISVLACTVGAFISTSMMKMHELYVALFVVLMSTLSSVLSALSRTSVEFYVFSIVGCMGNLLNPMVKTQITRNVAKADLGKVFAFISTTEAFLPMIASPLYRAVYNQVLDSQPLEVFFLSAAFWMLCGIVIIVILLIQAFCTRDYREFIINESSEEGISQPFEDEPSNETI